MALAQTPPEPTPAEAARITVARGRVQGEHDAVLAVAEAAAEEQRITVLLDALTASVDHVRRLEGRRGDTTSAPAHMPTSRDQAVWLAELREILGR